MAGPRRSPDAAASDARQGSSDRSRIHLPLRVLESIETLLLYLVSVVLLAIGAGILIVSIAMLFRSHLAWAERFIAVIESLLLLLIVIEIFTTILTHLQGGRLLLEPFLIVGVIAVVRHILSVVVRLALPTAPPQSRGQLIELAVNAGVVLVLVAALALSRWSQQRSSSAS
jgi:uncharacterized membrane protein (DUF373 family)